MGREHVEKLHLKPNTAQPSLFLFIYNEVSTKKKISTTKKKKKKIQNYTHIKSADPVFTSKLVFLKFPSPWGVSRAE